MANDSLLRPMRVDDIDQVLAWRNHFDVRRYMYTCHEIERSEHVSWYEKASKEVGKHLLIFEQNSQPAGFVNITLANVSAQRADWGFYLAPEAAKGAGRSLGEAAINHVFKDLGLHKLCGEALAFNEKSRAFHLRLGFSQEGCWRDHHYDGERYHDVIAFGLLSSEWKNHHEEQ